VYLLVVIAAFGTLNWAPIKAREIHVARKDLDVVALAKLLREIKSERGEVVVNARKRTIRVVDLPWEVDRMTRVVRAIGQSDADDEKIWVTPVEFALASEMAAKLNEVLNFPSRGRTESISAIIPDDRRNRLIIVANERGYSRLRRMLVGCGDPEPAPGPTKTEVIYVRNRDIDELASLLQPLESERGRVTVQMPTSSVHIEGLPDDVDRMAAIVREVDQPETAGLRIWTIPVRDPSEMARKLDELADHNRGWPDASNIAKIIPDDVGHRLIVVADDAGYLHLKRMRLNGSPAPSPDP